MLNSITAASSSTTGGITGGQRQLRTLGIPSKCWCGESIIKVIPKSRPNLYHRYYRCLYAASLRLENDDHVFKWVDEAFTDEIQQLDYQVKHKIKHSGAIYTSIYKIKPYVQRLYSPVPPNNFISGSICMTISCHIFYLTLTIMNKKIIHTYGIVYVPPADVKDFMDTLEFHVMQIVQRVDDVDLSIPNSS
ncbi:hypothetical protein N665_0057s0033 [Sinapis alba]|nr:hypothetical protein N665_0057s0033 [Sinapis alba]